MPIKYEVYDKQNPDLRGSRFTKREGAEKELKHAFPRERFDIREVGRGA